MPTTIGDIEFDIVTSGANPKKQIYLRVWLGKRERYVRIPTDKYILLEHWDKDKKTIKSKAKVPNRKGLIRVLEAKRNQLDKIIQHLQLNNEPITKTALKSRWRGEGSGTLAEFAQNTYLDQVRKKNGQPIKNSTKEQYQAIIKKLTVYDDKIKLTQVTPEFLQEYQDWLLSKGKMPRKNVPLNRKNGSPLEINSVASHMTFWLAVLTFAFKKKYIHYSPVPHWDNKMTIVKIPKQYCSVEEIEQLEKAFHSGRFKNYVRKLGGPKGRRYHYRDNLHITLQAFLVSMFTGLRYSDIRSVANKDSNDGDIISLRQVKTQAYHTVKVTKRLAGIINLDGGPIFHGKIPSNHLANRHLKIICHEIGIKSNITFHSARHSLAMLLVNQGVQMEVVQRILGHKSLQSTMTYARIEDSTRDRHLTEILDGALGGKHPPRPPASPSALLPSQTVLDLLEALNLTSEQVVIAKGVLEKHGIQLPSKLEFVA